MNKNMPGVHRHVNERGSVPLLFALLMVLMTATVAISLSKVSLINLRVSGNFRDSAATLFIAQAGVEHAIALLVSDPTWRGQMASNGYAMDATLNDGRYRVWVYDESTDTEWDLSRWSSALRIRSMGVGSLGSRREVDVIVSLGTQPREFFGYGGFSCQALEFHNSTLDRIIDRDVYASGNLLLKGRIESGNAQARGNLTTYSTAFINGNVNANQSVQLTGSMNPSVTGNAEYGGSISNPGQVAGSVTQVANTVPDLCGNDIDDLVAMNPFTMSEFDEIRTEPGVIVHGGTWTISSSTTIQGTHWVPAGNWKITGSYTIRYKGDVTVIVDGGNVEWKNLTLEPDPTEPDSTLIVIAPTGGILIDGSADVTMSGILWVGQLDDSIPKVINASSNIEVKGNADVHLYGSALSMSGHVRSASSSARFILESPANLPPRLEQAGGAVQTITWIELTSNATTDQPSPY